MLFLRSFDGLLCAIFAGIFLASNFLNFLLPVVPVTALKSSVPGVVSADMKAFCADTTLNNVNNPNLEHIDSSVVDLCTCLAQPDTLADGSNCVLGDGVPDVQHVVHWVNPNWLLFWIFTWGFVYQLVLRDSLDVRTNHDADIATWLCLFLGLAGAILSIFQHEKPIDLFSLGFFLPQQAVVGVGFLIVWWNIEANNSDDKFKRVLWNGAQKVAVIPFSGVLLALFQHVSDVETLLYIYHLLLFLAVCDFCYGLVSVESEMDPQNPAKLRLQQSTYLGSLVTLLAYTLYVVLFMPQEKDAVMRRASLVFTGILWLQHLLYEAAQTRSLKLEHARAFNVSDAMVSTVRYSLGFYTAYLCFQNK